MAKVQWGRLSLCLGFAGKVRPRLEEFAISDFFGGGYYMSDGIEKCMLYHEGIL